jgi:phosphatidylinositol alpha-1,6-mannosyltransferase
MKRTLLLTHEYYPFHGGVANYCYDLFSHLPEQNYVVATDMREQGHPSASSGQGEGSGSGNTTTTKLLTPYIRPRWLIGLWTVSRLIKREKIQLIFTPNIFPLGQICYWLHCWYKIPYIISLHGLDIRLALKKNKKLVSKIVTNSHHVITNSQGTADVIKGLIPAEKITIITPYLHTTLATDTTAKKVSTDSINLLSVGRLVKRKGHDMVIQAIKLLDNPNLHYTIIGSGAEEQNLRDLIKEWKLTNNVVIKTKVSDEELKEYYQSADIFIMTTRMIGADVEGFGIVYVEAASFGLPIIASRGSSAEELFDTTTACLVDGTKPESVAQGINSLISDAAQRQRLAAASMTIFKQLPSWQDKAAVVSKLLD